MDLVDFMNILGFLTPFLPPAYEVREGNVFSLSVHRGGGAGPVPSPVPDPVLGPVSGLVWGGGGFPLVPGPGGGPLVLGRGLTYRVPRTIFGKKI